MCQRDLTSQARKELAGMSLYDDLWEAKGNIEAGLAMIYFIILNTRNDKARYYLKGSLPSLRQGLGWISDTEFEMATSRDDDEEEPEEEI